MQVVTDPMAAALAKRGKNRRKEVQKKRKLQELIVSRKGGLGREP